jgi:hypothetical protein
MVLRISVQLGMLILLVGLTVAPFGSSLLRPAPAEAQAVADPACHGDELISFAPPDAVVGQEMLIAVTSAQPHTGLYMTGTERVTTSAETVGQLGHVWLWSVTPRLPGPHRFQFFIDFTKFCAEATINVAPNPLGNVDPLVSGSPVPFTDPYALPTLIPIDLGNDNNLNDNDDNDNFDDDNDNDLDGDNINDNIEEIREPRIADVDCKSSNRQVTIFGDRFGSSQTIATGLVYVQSGNEAPREATTYLAWQKKEIAVLVDHNPVDRVYVVNSAGFDMESGGCLGDGPPPEPDSDL